MNNKIKLAVIPFILTLGACSSSSDSTTPGTGGSIEIVTVSGTTLDVSGVWGTVCYSGGQNSTDIQEALLFSGSVVTYEMFGYTSTDASCAGSATSIQSYAATVAAASSNSAISGWTTGGGSATTAPDAADGSGLLSDTEAFTDLAYTFTALVNISGPAVGDTFHFVYVADDTGTTEILYRGDYADETALTGATAGIADPFFKQ